MVDKGTNKFKIECKRYKDTNAYNSTIPRRVTAPQIKRSIKRVLSYMIFTTTDNYAHRMSFMNEK